MTETPYCVVLITTEKPAEAGKIARLLVEQRLAACVNTVPRVDSLFRWEGELETAAESLLIVKARRDSLPEITRRVKEAHSYSVPEVIALPIIGGNDDYLDWLGEATD